MKMKTGYVRTLTDLGIKNLPDRFKIAYEAWDGVSGHVVTEEELNELIVGNMSEDGINENAKSLLNRLQEERKYYEDHPEIYEFIKFLTWTQVDRRYECWMGSETDLIPTEMKRHGEAFPFLFCLSCIGQGRKEMKRRNIPEAYYKDIPNRMIKRQLEQWMQKKDHYVEDLPWKLNFYSLSIFYFKRFLFVPCSFEDPYRFFRKGEKVVALAKAGLSIDRMGQLIADSKEGQKSGNGYEYGTGPQQKDFCFRTELGESENHVCAYQASPCGYVSREKVRLRKSEWKEILSPGDSMIGLHIPEGEGYTPQNLRESMKLAWKFFSRYYPDMEFKGFWSASWLFDGRLSMFLPGNSRIIQVQRQLFMYSGGFDGTMAYEELYGGLEIPLDEAPMETVLQRKVAEYFRRGGRLCERGMVFFPEELDKNMMMPVYMTESDLEKQREMFEGRAL